MNKRIYIIILLMTGRICVAQNLVPNGDFELYSGCPNGGGQIDSALFWINPTGGTPDYFNQCSISITCDVPYNFYGYQPALSGLAYSGIVLYYPNNIREYIEVPIIPTLLADTCYHIELNVNLSNNSKYTTDKISAYFSDTVVLNVLNLLPLQFSPQITNVTGTFFDTVSWVSVAGDYIAHGGESYLIIGNFEYDSTTTLVVSSGGGSDYSFCYIDNVSLTQTLPCSTGINEQNEIANKNIYPNPFNDKLTFRNNNGELSEIILYDITSRKTLQKKFTNSVSLNTEQLAKGLYLYELRSKDGSCKKGKVVKD